MWFQASATNQNGVLLVLGYNVARSVNPLLIGCPAQALKVGLIGRPEMSVRNYHYLPCNNAEDSS